MRRRWTVCRKGGGHRLEDEQDRLSALSEAFFIGVPSIPVEAKAHRYADRSVLGVKNGIWEGKTVFCPSLPCETVLAWSLLGGCCVHSGVS